MRLGEIQRLRPAAATAALARLSARCAAEVRRRPGPLPGGHDQLLWVLRDLPAAAGAHDRAWLSPAGQSAPRAVDCRLRAWPVPGDRPAAERWLVARQCARARARPRRCALGGDARLPRDCSGGCQDSDVAAGEFGEDIEWTTA